MPKMTHKLFIIKETKSYTNLLKEKKKKRRKKP